MAHMAPRQLGGTGVARRAVLREASASVTVADGTRAFVAEGGDTLRVADAKGRVLFEHRAGEGRTIVYAPAGDLELRADHGRIDLVAAEGIRLHSERKLELEGERSVTVTTPALSARTGVATLMASEASVVAKTLTTAAETARHVAGVLEVEAGRIVERAKNAYREIEELSQTRAGRMRLVAKATFHLLGERALLKAEKEMKLDGEKIYLA